MYEIVLEEAYQPEFGRAYYSQTIVKSMISLMDAMMLVPEYNREAKGNQYFFYREIKGENNG